MIEPGALGDVRERAGSLVAVKPVGCTRPQFLLGLDDRPQLGDRNVSFADDDRLALGHSLQVAGKMSLRLVDINSNHDVDLEVN